MNIRKQFCFFFFLWGWPNTGTGCAGRLNILGDFYKSSGHGHGLLASGGPVWARRLDKMMSRGHFQLQMFCECTPTAPWQCRYFSLFSNTINHWTTIMAIYYNAEKGYMVYCWKAFIMEFNMSINFEKLTICECEEIAQLKWERKRYWI